MENSKNTTAQYIHHFSEICQDDFDKVGGKGANLAALTAAGFSVPPGFCLATQAYREFIGKAGIEEKITAKITSLDLDVFENIRMCGAVIRELIMGAEMPEGIQEAILEVYRELLPSPNPSHQGRGMQFSPPLVEGAGGGEYVAIRSSATAEDLPNMSFAGQHDTYLNISGEADVLFCVKKCWASLWSDRAIAYRYKNNIDHTAVLMAVVIQQMVPATVSGILFTANPVTNTTNELVINAAWGLGESVVSGKISPDEYSVDKETGTVTNKNIAEKTEMITLGDNGAVEMPVPLEQQKQVCLTDEQIRELTGIATRIEEFFGTPQDIEWGLCENQFFILQSRPITTLQETSPPIPVIWANQTVEEKLRETVVFWSNWNVRETLPYPLTPLSWSYFSDVIFPGLFKNFFQITPESPLYPYYSSGVDLVYGRLYWNMNAL
jgi:pyruvate,water dikinase